MLVLSRVIDEVDKSKLIWAKNQHNHKSDLKSHFASVDNVHSRFRWWMNEIRLTSISTTLYVWFTILENDQQAVGDVLPIWDVDLESNHLSCSFSSPEALPPPPPIFPTHQCPSSNISFGGQISFKESKEVVTNRIKSSRKWRDDGCFIVPQITPPSNPSSKRSRTFW